MPSEISENFVPVADDPDPVIEAYKEGVDRTLIRENLKLTSDQRMQNLMKLQAFADELQRAGRDARAPFPHRWAPSTSSQKSPAGEHMTTCFRTRFRDERNRGKP